MHLLKPELAWLHFYNLMVSLERLLHPHHLPRHQVVALVPGLVILIPSTLPNGKIL